MRKILVALLIIIAASCKNENSSQNSAATPIEHSPEMQESISRGARIYNNFCASCHLTGGEGIAGVFPPLKDSDWLTDKRTASIRAVKHGISGPIKVNGKEYDNLMPPLGLDDQQVADVMNYINNAWGNQVEKPVTVEEVAAIKK